MTPNYSAGVLQSRWMHGFVMAVLLLGLPPAGLLLAGKDVGPYLQFPPLTRYVAHAPFSWTVFGLYAAINLAGIFLIVHLLLLGRRSGAGRRHVVRTSRMPWWGWLGSGVMAGGWLLAWTRMEWFALFQHHTFILPWMGYILLVNGLCVRRTGKSLLTDAPARFWALFPVSAVFWWFFEYLNRFVQNWYYLGVEDFGTVAYIIFATLAFSTVLPAVLSTYRLLLSFDGIDPGLRRIMPVRLGKPRPAAIAVLFTASLGLFFLGIYPNWLFALLWISPLLILVSLQTLSGRPTIFAPLTAGDWHPVVAAALAALICGFIWELWNVGSLAQWQYSIPFVDRFRIFAMPVLGYGGYLPFGLECLVVGDMVLGRHFLRLDASR
jgi:hypothetical protein